MKKEEPRRLPIDKDKLNRILFERKLVKNQMGLEMAGYRQYFSNEIRDGLRHQTVVMLDKLYGITYDMIKPDEPKKEKPEEEKKQTETPAAAPAAQADLAKLEDMMQRAVRLLNQNDEFVEMVKQGFRVRTTPQLMTQDISEGARQGMEAFWRNTKKEFISQMNGLVYAAVYKAISELFNQASKEGRRA